MGKIPWRREWQPTPVFLTGESHGQRSFAGNSPYGHKESDTTEQMALSLFFTAIERKKKERKSNKKTHKTQKCNPQTQASQCKEEKERKEELREN